ncbi:translational GTPase TypA [Simkania negevensis]|uniref:Large ribosomal subunit assembly factor BipA n=1 Tax=Simkania negevensis (strain ATCC VR-1471 / DSM 27360 / Z) TaxID=331113 RepID=F8L5F8_SIMNZ|nr:GTP-binding protein TypA/BipA homolog [Simkania negevensis Z]
MYSPEKIRNLAIIAHIDHGKTTLMDALLRQANVFRENEAVPERVMDSYELEKERGITIFAKHTSLIFEDFKINLIDTPGHADFSGEVERVLGMVNSVLLLIDAQEGPMPQTRFVLSRALKMGLNPIVVVNKIDRPNANPDAALDKTFDLFVELGATDEQLDFAYCFVSALEGYAIRDLKDPKKDLQPLFKLILEKVPPPPGRHDLPFLMQASTLSYNDYLGRQATGRILEGVIKKGESFTLVDKDGHPTNFKVTRLEGYLGLQKIEMDEAGVGDIVSISGAPEVMIGDTLCDPKNIRQLPSIELGEPTLSVEMQVNSGPFAGKEGKHVTMNKIRDRLAREKKSNISLKVEEVAGREDAIRISGRGELHLSILMEAMRREGFEFLVSKPQVILKIVDGAKHEPIESTHIEVPEEFSGSIIEELNRRKGEMHFFNTNEHGITTIQYYLPTRGLIGYRNEFLTATKGLGILTSIFHDYAPHKGEIPSRKNGALVSLSEGKVTAYACFNIQDRGSLFVKPTDPVYEGMIVGENSRDNDLTVNITREKQLTNVRASGADEHLTLTPPRKLTLEQAIDFIQDDEFVEVTPKSIRLRKKFLKETDRKRKK